MRLSLFASVCALQLMACGPMKMTVDSGPDTSCGFDCVAQNRYGLVLNRCFEYSTDGLAAQTPPSLGVWVVRQKQQTGHPDDGLFYLEGDVPTLVVEYRQGGQTVQTDYLGIKNSDLYLMRRIAGGQSVTYKSADSKITGVKWLTTDVASGQNFSTDTGAFLSRDNTTTPTTYRVTTDTPTGAEKRTPLMTYDNAVKVLYGETPDHGADPRRVFVPDVGFTVIASPFSLLGGSPTPHYLQKIRDIGSPDGGSDACSLGVP
ncbi:MAG: hypothetical protein U0228_24620 [Myxococcaceae bacterium]